MTTRRFGLSRTVSFAILAVRLCVGRTARPEEPVSIDLTLKDHRFSPSEIRVASGKPILLRIKNEDATAEEFDSSALKVEKIVAAGASATVRLRPLGPGRFPFMGEFHPDTAQGVVISE
jgi:hypothetical protein